MFYKEVAHSCKQMLGGISSTDAVITVGIDVHIELFVQLNKRFAIFRCITQMYIIIGRTMNE